MSLIFDWPSNLKFHTWNLPYLEKLSASAGVSLTAQERVVASDAGRWRFKFTTMVWNKRYGEANDKILALRGLFALTQGRVHRVRVPILDPAEIYGTYGLTAPSSAGIPHSDGAYFSDGSGYSGSGLYANLTTPAVAGATSITANFITGVAPQIGMYFSDGDFTYVITGVTANGGTSFTLTFLPRLRQAIGNGATISMTRLRCIMRLVDDSALAAAMDPARAASVELDWAEAPA